MLSLIFLLFTPSAMAEEKPYDLFWDALINDDVPGVVAQIKAGVSVDSVTDTETPLTYAIKLDSNEMVAALLEQGANPNLAQPISQYTPLMVAAKYEKTESVELLLARSADVNVTTLMGRNPLHVAALNDSIEVARILLTKTDIDVNARGKLCPLAVASRQGYLQMVQLMIKEAKVSPSAKCLASSKDMASYNQNTDVLNLLNSIK